MRALLAEGARGAEPFPHRNPAQHCFSMSQIDMKITIELET
jgi:hypothetical protein